MSDNLLRFTTAVSAAAAGYSEQGGIGTYSEKMLHRVLKFYFEPCEDNHEIDYLGSVADILNGEGVTEIQTASFNRLLPKLRRFLPETKVRVVCPVVEQRTIMRVDLESGESRPPRKSPKKGKPSDAFANISMIRDFVCDPNLEVVIVMLDVTETRLISGKVKVGRKRTDKVNSMPTALNSEITLRRPEDYLALLPEDMPTEFSAKEFSSRLGLKGMGAHGSLMLLMQLGLLSRRKEGRAYIYTMVKPD